MFFDSSPSPSASGGGGPKLEPKVLAILAGVGFCCLLAFTGDQAVFGPKPPSGWLQVCLSYITVFAYKLVEDRLMAGVLVTGFWAALFAGVGFYLFELYVTKYVEPKIIKQKIAAIKREKELINKLDDGTI